MVGELIELPDGSLQGPAGVVYRRTPERVSRRAGRELVRAGAPVVTNVYPEGLRWFAGTEALDAWNDIAPRLVAGRPPAVRDLQWTGRVWRAANGDPLLRFEGQH
ncbi:hypothetical protein AZH51_02760 [Branchiibius sp. NY16-3462-2]|nr:hypothetical protein AZH51_02760 [Branchiibius sp. NY16-3462-2]